MSENEKLVERASAAITLGDRTGSRGNSPSNIYNVAADLLTALTAAQARIRELETALDKARVDVVCAVSFLARDIGTDRERSTVAGVIETLCKTDNAIRAIRKEASDD